MVPVLNEERSLARLLPALCDGPAEVIVADGGSSDSTLEAASRFPVRVVRSRPGRAVQMNTGAAQAAGDVLWFLHADSQIPAGWEEQMARALADPAVVGGGFRVRIGAPGAGYRWLDAWGRWRARLERSFYGDQGIFVRRPVFERLGGFCERARLEDLEFSLRMSRAGKVRCLPGPLLTSARRWQAERFWPTVARHCAAVLSEEWRIRAGWYAPPTVTLFIVAKAPVAGKVKTRLVPHLTPEQAAQMAGWMLQGAVRSAQRLRGVEPVVAVDPPEAADEMSRWLGGGVRVVPQSEGDLGARLEDLFHRGLDGTGRAAIVLGSDHPGLPQRYLRAAVRWLSAGAGCRIPGGVDRAVLGPTEDGGYYLLGLSRPHPELLRGIPWSTPQVFRVTLERARAAGLKVRVLPRWFDVDHPEDLKRLTPPT